MHLGVLEHPVRALSLMASCVIVAVASLCPITLFRRQTVELFRKVPYHGKLVIPNLARTRNSTSPFLDGRTFANEISDAFS